MFYAVAIGKDFANTCKIGSLGKIHSVFERAINIEIICQANYLLTLICENIDIMPASLVIRIPSSTLEGFVKADDKVIFTPDIVYIRNIPVIGGISFVPRWERLIDDKIAELMPHKFDTILCACKAVEEYLNKEIPQNSDFPSMHILHLDPINLLGLGSGLTPSGDDFLAGMLFGIHFMEKLYGKKCPYLPRVVDIIAKNLHRTGEISRHFLTYALRGEWGKNTENFLVSLINDDREALMNAVVKKLAFGASSGSDELRGCLYGINEYIRNG